jgi:hypothetical protein
MLLTPETDVINTTLVLKTHVINTTLVLKASVINTTLVLTASVGVEQGGVGPSRAGRGWLGARRVRWDGAGWGWLGRWVGRSGWIGAVGGAEIGAGEC